VTLAADVLGSGRPIVLLPMFSLDRSSMRSAFEPLLDGYQRIYVDLPGHGESPGGPVADSDGVVDAVVEFLDGRAGIGSESESESESGSGFGSGDVLVAGCSYGGYIAAAVARRRPVAGLLLVCHGTKIRFEDRDLSGIPTASTDRGWLSGVPAELRDHLATALGTTDATVAERVAGVIAASGTGDEDFRHRLRTSGYRLSDEDADATFTGPTSIIAGRQDRIAGIADQFRSLRDYPDATFSAVDRAGHYLPYERPGLFASLVADWLDRVETAHPSAAAKP
jgi:pimeloyl-ACP methyl ester carboxylesterase